MTRVAIDALGATEPSVSSQPRRFSPVRCGVAQILPVLYAGEDLGCALGETVFHDLPDDPAVPGEVFRADLLTLRASTIEIKRDVELADLTDAGLAALGYGRDEVATPGPAEYDTTAKWGQLAWDQGGLNGLVWNSRRTPNRLSFMLFVDSVSSSAPTHSQQLRRRADVDSSAPPTNLYDGPGLDAVFTEASSRNVTVVFS
ncbi:MAG: hypothetical protein JWO62_3319 [Acidimicrobiaceae bacterium]|nr:hypothetical protein [Acidimicrobiaceae bacterium]